MSELVSRWLGCGLMLVVAVSTVVLAATGRLTLYVHPRYVVFTTVLAVLAIVAVGSVVVLAGTAREHGHGDDHGHGHGDDHGDDHDHHGHVAPGRRGSWLARGGWLASGALVITVTVALLVVPPAGLSTTIRQDRELVTSSRALDDTAVPDLTGGDASALTVKDWAVLLRQAGPDAAVGKRVDVSGYVLDQHDADVFYVARMMITCCAVDAQPVGIPVRRPGWRTGLKEGSWVQVDGTFVATDDSRYGAVVETTEVAPIPEPRDPYVF